jgi:hypothetical protein
MFFDERGRGVFAKFDRTQCGADVKSFSNTFSRRLPAESKDHHHCDRNYEKSGKTI